MTMKTLAYIQGFMMSIVGVIGIGFGLYGMFNLDSPLVALLALGAGMMSLFWGVPMSITPPFGYGSWEEYG